MTGAPEKIDILRLLPALGASRGSGASIEDSRS